MFLNDNFQAFSGAKMHVICFFGRSLSTIEPENFNGLPRARAPEKHRVAPDQKASKRGDKQCVDTR